MILLRWVIAAASLWLALYLDRTFIDPASTHIATHDPVVKMLVAVVALGIANAVIRPIVKLLTLPLNCLTFGLFSFVINALMFWGAGAVTGAYQVGFIGALVGSILMGIINGIASNVLIDKGDKDR